MTKDASSMTKDASSMTKDAPSITKDAPSITKDASSITKVASSMTKVASSMTKVASSMTKDASSMTKDAPSITKDASSMVMVRPLVSKFLGTVSTLQSWPCRDWEITRPFMTKRLLDLAGFVAAHRPTAANISFSFPMTALYRDAATPMPPKAMTAECRRLAMTRQAVGEISMPMDLTRDLVFYWMRVCREEIKSPRTPCC